MTDCLKIVDEWIIDSEGLAILSENEHRAVAQLIRNHTNSLESFGSISFEMSKPDSKGGRPKKTYLLNEQQATLLTTFMKNSPKVVEFKRKLVFEFFRMRQYILKQETIRLAGIETRKTLTDAIQESGEQERMHGHGYSTYTNMIYEITGLKGEYKQFKSDQKIITGYDKLEFRNVLNERQLKRLEQAEALVKPLLELDKQYSEIKDTLKPIFEIKKVTT